MKKVLLGMLFCGAAATAFAQQNSVQKNAPVADKPSVYIQEPAADPAPTGGGQRAANPLSKWYNWLDAAYTNNGIEFTFYNNSSIFPDSTVKQVYGTGVPGEVQLGYVGIMGEGVVFDPKAQVFGDSALTKWHKYKWDSVAVFYSGYKRWPENPNADTLILQYYVSPTAIVKSSFPNSGDKTAFVRYDYKTNLGTGAKITRKYLLEDKDTTSTTRALVLPVDTNVITGIDVPADGLCAVTVSFRPGYSYSVNDTLDERWTNPKPTKRLNHLKLAIGHDLTKTSDESYNNGLRIIAHQRYNIPPAPNSGDWRGSYISGDAWNSYNEYLYASFHVTTPHFLVGMQDADMNGYGMSEAFPNPTNGTATVKFSLGKSENVNITLYNALGQPVQSVANGNFPMGPNSVGINANSLKPGIYFYTITAGQFTKTLKLNVAR
jgi:hypothetical protein